ncbi:hypothetical protein QJV44_gp40 [Serratia phage vB_SmaS_Tlacuache]|uniref:Uncharacterized protein n=1 Tax=Serratia phage vB_SmaS_Tlacuache TaxID=2894809 RepID=A0AAE8YYU8_9CAUD|nr:hypothetical protein QJV44_gp40 [Serratia phage vB_SmaS_Tlacuache]UGO51454.1 hypothetical protein TLACUACHE_40 [Serratia phage vB_SmaS_Tlacuache]
MYPWETTRDSMAMTAPTRRRRQVPLPADTWAIIINISSRVIRMSYP